MSMRRSSANISRHNPRLFILLLLFLIPLAQSVLNSGNAQAAIWQHSSGIANGCGWTNSGSDKGLFGKPAITEDALQLSLTNFLAQSIDSVGAITSNRLQFDINAQPGSDHYFSSDWSNISQKDRINEYIHKEQTKFFEKENERDRKTGSYLSCASLL